MKKLILILCLILLPILCYAGGVMMMGGGTPAGAPPAGIDLTLDKQVGSDDGGTGTVTITKPTGTVDGDFLLAVFSVPYGKTLTTLSGWTLISTATYGYAQHAIYTYYKRASSEGANYVWQVSAASYAQGVIWRITGVVGTGSPEDCTRAYNFVDDGSTAVSSTSITTATNGAAVVQLGGTNDNYISLSSTTLTERYDNGIEVFIMGDVQASAGASGTKTGTLGTSRPFGVYLIALKPAP